MVSEFLLENSYVLLHFLELVSCFMMWTIWQQGFFQANITLLFLQILFSVCLCSCLKYMLFCFPRLWTVLLARLDASVKHIAVSVNVGDTEILTSRKVAFPNKIVKGKNVLRMIHHLLRWLYCIFSSSDCFSTVNECHAFLLIMRNLPKIKGMKLELCTLQIALWQCAEVRSWGSTPEQVFISATELWLHLGQFTLSVAFFPKVE